ncbi:SUMO-activating enzyme subunit 2 [Heterocephalus glaber]|uniref:SUMO-activating enzyme subunit 2 n=1 Tax=Heterocephalus glaber TaxID=10181 RepID=G5BRJ0_HETGA|nr:SUMO-activating enzyme subunit 2 [Heterocephalus glaber]
MALCLGLPQELAEAVAGGQVLVVGAGGIGCELLKTLMLTGFSHMDLIDLDNINVSNLNRQFLFQKKHVGRSKAQVAKESVLQFYTKANIVAYHDSIMSPDYNVEFFRQFILVMNALDNRAAPNHVNRMCLAADVPLIESGTAGNLGQVTTIKKGVTQCYESHLDYTLLINILHSEDLGKDIEFEVVGDAPDKVGPKQAKDATRSITNGNHDGAQPSTSTAQEQDVVLIVDSDEEGPSNNADNNEDERNCKRKLDEKENISAKRSCMEQREELD